MPKNITDRVFYVSQVVADLTVDPPREGAMHFTTPNEVKARAQVAVDPTKRFLFIFEDGQLVNGLNGAPRFLALSATRKESQRRDLEQQAAAAQA